MGVSPPCAVLVVTLVGTPDMGTTKVILTFLLFGAAAQGAKRLTPNSARGQRSLVNTFPFNAQGADDHAHGHHEHTEHSEHQVGPARSSSNALGSRGAKQGGSDQTVSFREVAGASPGSDGKRCIDKVDMVEETEYDDVVQCDHSYDKRCHTTYVTNYESQQEEECEENYRKSCLIEYESECWTKQEVHDVEDDVVECTTEVEEKCEDETSGYTTNTKCSKWPKEVCSVSKKQ